MVDDPELIELVEMEVTEQLEEYGFEGCPIIKGSALKALEDPNGEWGDKIMELMDTVDEYIPDPQRDTQISHSLGRSRMYSQSQVVVQLLPDVLREVHYT